MQELSAWLDKFEERASNIEHIQQTFATPNSTLLAMQRRFPTRQRLAAPLPRPIEGRKVFAANLRRLRRERGLTQEALAETTGLDRSYISLMENVHCNVSLDNICRIAAVLGVEPDVLLRRA